MPDLKTFYCDPNYSKRQTPKSVVSSYRVLPNLQLKNLCLKKDLTVKQCNFERFYTKNAIAICQYDIKVLTES